MEKENKNKSRMVSLSDIIDDREMIEEENKDKKQQKKEQKEEKEQKQQPDFRVVQADRDKNGGIRYTDVGYMYKYKSKNNNEYYEMKIGHLKLLVFKNENKK